MFLLGKNHFFDYFNIDLGFGLLAPPPSYIFDTALMLFKRMSFSNLKNMDYKQFWANYYGFTHFNGQLRPSLR